MLPRSSAGWRKRLRFGPALRGNVFIGSRSLPLALVVSSSSLRRLWSAPLWSTWRIKCGPFARRRSKRRWRLLTNDQYGLLSSSGSFGDLFYLPLRISRLLGWIGAQHFIGAWIGKPGVFDEDLIGSLLERTFETYSSSLVTVSEAQAGYLLTFLLCCHERGWDRHAELVVGHMFNDFVTRRGKVARSDVDQKRVFEFLVRRRDGEFSDAFELLSNPSEILPVLLMAGHLSDLEGVIDPYLNMLDHHSFNIFIPRDHKECGAPIIYDGINNTYEIGNGIWKTEEFYSTWTEHCLPQIDRDSSLDLPCVRIGALLMALLLSDRSPWFVARSL